MTEPNYLPLPSRLLPGSLQQVLIGFLLLLTVWTGFWLPPHALADVAEDVAIDALAATAAVVTSQGEREAAVQVRQLGKQMVARQRIYANASEASRQGYAFEGLDAMKQQVELGGKGVVTVPESTANGSADIIIKGKAGRVLEQQQLKLNSTAARSAFLQAERGEKYTGMSIRTPSGQPPKPGVVQSGVSRAEVAAAVKDPVKAASHYARQADIKVMTKGMAAGVVTGTATTVLTSGLRNGLAAQRGEIEVSTAIVSTVKDTAETLVVAGLVGAGAALTAAVVGTFVPSATGLATGAITTAVAIVAVPIIAWDLAQTTWEVKSIWDDDRAKRSDNSKKVSTQEASVMEAVLLCDGACVDAPHAVQLINANT